MRVKIVWLARSTKRWAIKYVSVVLCCIALCCVVLYVTAFLVSDQNCESVYMNQSVYVCF